MRKDNNNIETIRENHNKQHNTVDIILIRHAQSVWNRENRFTGWANPPLTGDGRAEAIQAGDCLARQGYHFDSAWSSRLLRADETLDILLDRLDQADIPRARDWRLNERHYGVLQGLNKADAARQVGDAQVWRWRRGYEDKATPLTVDDPGHPVNDPLYRDIDPALLPGVENLAETRERVSEFWREQIVPRIRQGQSQLISAHGNTLRALLMELDGMSVEEVESFEIPTATPILYRFDSEARPLGWWYVDDCMEERAA